MNSSGDAAEQIVRMSLEGIEVAAKITGAGAKNIAAILYTILKNKDKNKIKGRQRLTAMLKSGKELKVFTVSEENLKQFTVEAKRYGVVYCALRGKNQSNDGLVDVMVRAEDASKINRIVERFKLSTVDAAAIKSEIAKSKAAKSGEKAAPEKAVPEKSKDDVLLDELMSKPSQKEQATPENPSVAKTEKSLLSEPTSESKSKSAEGTSKSEKLSVREELRSIQTQRKKEAEALKLEDKTVLDKKPPQKITQHKQPTRKKKPKSKER
ncbi:PcfB family protein [Pygmaiobacter massiliensis]|uniref:PcfB family protein n=1 Tax=Pygmaiobacter massiliensis TaxID=1917873 RepID=UPI002896AFF7|nr:PcfB family protein [Pygmaiobacter massiliensis]